MSGLEVAGVVLGSLPLVISALEHYAAGVATAKRYFRYKSELRSLVLQMNTERSIFINTMEQLLTGIVRIEHMSEFVSNIGSAVWKEQGIDELLRKRLGNAHDAYMGNVKGMESSLNTMMKKLALDPDGKPQFTDPSLFKQEYKRLKFSVSKSEYTEQLGDLRNYNQALTRLTKQSLELEPSRAETKARVCPNFKALQNYARSLYEILRSGLQCGCQSHAVKLRLESRNMLEKEEEELLEHTPFRIVFGCTAGAGSSTLSPTLWKEANIQYIVDKPKRVPLTPPTSNPCTPPASGRRVRFNQLGMQAQQGTQAHGSTLTVVAQQTIPIIKPTSEQIQNLCEEIAKLQQPQRDTCIGYLVDKVKRKHGIYLLGTPASCSQQQWAAYSLRDVLLGRANISRRLTQYDKLRIAVDLASSVLQLYKTPWLDEHWNNEDVYFVQRPGAATASIYEHPFVYRKFSPMPTGQRTDNVQPAACRVIRNQSLFTLGVLLIELWYGKSIEELQLPCDLDCQGTPGVSWCTAERIVENDIEFEAGKRYSDVVRRCIRCDFDRKNTNLDNVMFQQAVFDGVVAPLEKNLRQFNSLD